MKKLFPLAIILFTLYSCSVENNDNFEKEITKNEQLLSPNRAPDFNFMLQEVTYVTGRIILNNEEVRNFILDLIAENNVVKLETLFDKETFKNEFHDIVNCILNNEPGCHAGRPGRVGVRPPIGSQTQRNVINNTNELNNRSYVDYNSYDELMHFIQENCLELYFPKELKINQGELNEHLYITNHPLINGRFVNGFYGFDLFLNRIYFSGIGYQTILDGVYTEFNEYLFEYEEYNILVLRPFRDQPNCRYENINVGSFRDFYDN